MPVTRMSHHVTMLSESDSSVGAPKSGGGSGTQPRHHILAAKGWREHAAVLLWQVERHLVGDVTSTISQITPSVTGDRFCVASDSDSTIEIESTGSHGAITTGVLPKRNRLGSCTEPVQCW